MSSAPLFFPTTFRPARDGWPSILSAWMPVVLFVCVFAIESTPFFGSDHTSRPLHAALHAVAGSSIDSNWTMVHHLIRKVGHFVGYGLFSLVLLRALRLNSGWLRRIDQGRVVGQMAAVGGTFLISGLDEWHQGFLPNRSGRFSDVLLDTAGAIALQLTLSGAIRAMEACNRRVRRNRPHAAMEELAAA